jgi:hypothetical protein
MPVAASDVWHFTSVDEHAEGDFQTIHPATRTAPRQNIDNLRMGKPMFSEGVNCAALKRSGARVKSCTACKMTRSVGWLCSQASGALIVA